MNCSVNQVHIINANGAFKNWDVGEEKECFPAGCNRLSKRVAFRLPRSMTHSEEYIFYHKPVAHTYI